MKILCAGFLIVAMVAFTSCSMGTRGGPGATDPNANKVLYGNANDTFNLSVPHMSTSLRQGETKSASIGISRGANYEEDVTLSFTNVPKGVTFEPVNPIIKRGDNERSFMLKAEDNASLGDFVVVVTGHPKTGADASNEFKLTVSKN
jgi:hypothetical protein